MANIVASMDSWSATAASNQPDSTDTATLQADLQQIQATVRANTNFKGADIASAGTTDLSTATGQFVDVTGTTTITAFGTLTAGMWKFIRFTGALTLTYNATSLIVPGAANITTANGDTCIAMSLGSGNWKVMEYTKASGLPAASGANSDITSTSAMTIASGLLSTPYVADVQDSRLTLTTAVPVTTSDVTGATTIYCTPYKGKSIALYDGSTRWNVRQSAEFSLALGTLTSGKPYDVFCYDNAGTPTLEFLVWTSDTARVTALVMQDGILVKTGATTRRYLGTFYTTATTTTEDSKAKRFLWNYYNRVIRYMEVIEATATWTYTTATWRQARATATNQLEFILGVAEDAVQATVDVIAGNSTATVFRSAGIGLDSTSALASGSKSSGSHGAANEIHVCVSSFVGIPAAGRHTLVWLEYSTALGTCTWYGTAVDTLSGITGSLLA